MMDRQSFFVIQELVAREIRRKYSRSKLGIIWSVLNPLLSMAVLSLIFSTMFRKSIENYPVYYLTGFLIWNFFTTATNTAMTALADNQMLILQVKLPRSVFPLARVCTAFVNYLYSLIAYLCILLFYRIPFTWHMLLYPVIVDSVLLTLWMYLSALFYPLELLPEGMQVLIWQNPVYNFIAAARDCILYGRMPGAAVWARVILWSLGVFLAGTWIFRESQNRIVQKL